MAVSVIPAYRVVSHFAKQSENLPAMDAVDAIEDRMRDYVRNLLSTLHPSFVEMGLMETVKHDFKLKPHQDEQENSPGMMKKLGDL